MTVHGAWSETPMSTVMRMSSVRGSPTDSGFGWTTQGWRPISVKIQPAEFARNGNGMAMSDRRANHVPAVPVGVRPFRVNSQASSAMPSEPAMRPIIARKLQ